MISEMIYIALLRGINVGGNNKIAMADLRAVFEQADMTNVATYINSGNVLFQSDEVSRVKLARRLEKAIERKFGFFVKVLVWDKPSVLELAKELPDEWVNDTAMKCDVMFLWEGFDSAAVMGEIVIRPEIDDVKYFPGALLWRVDRDKVTRSGLLRIVGTDLYKHMTIRNCNTLRKLAVLLESYPKV
jgi:uncharacterized protein (DUF1697 family)